MGPGTKTSLVALNPSYYVWEPTNPQIRVAINLDVIETLKSYFNEAAQQEVEAGGLLLGTVRESGDGATPAVTIERFDAVEIKHLRGPAFSLTDREKMRLQKRMVALQEQQRPLTVVGIVRSHNRRGLYLDVADFAVFRQFFQGPHSVFLVVRTGSNPTAGFFFGKKTTSAFTRLTRSFRSIVTRFKRTRGRCQNYWNSPSPNPQAYRPHPHLKQSSRTR
jgi:hypothetical protein